jgi:hypothetical protein
VMINPQKICPKLKLSPPLPLWSEVMHWWLEDNWSNIEVCGAL